MAEFVIGDVRRVREFTSKDMVNLHLVDGWVLLLVRVGQELDRNFDTGNEETVATTVYVIGWIGNEEPPNTQFYQDELRTAPIDEDDPF